jgi:mono/diheme cytochrome c family protein
MNTKQLTTLTAGLLFAAGVAQAADQDLLAHGQKVFESTCIACHSYAPPPKNAPPMLGISAYYHQAFSSEDEAVAHMIDFIKHPSKEKSILLRSGGRNWPLMPPMGLSDADLKAVAYWILESNPSGTQPHRGMGMGMMNGGGPGRMMR